MRWLAHISSLLFALSRGVRRTYETDFYLGFTFCQEIYRALFLLTLA